VDILLIGGYRFLGRALILAAQARGHAVTAFNRGSLTPLAGVEQITGDRSVLDLPAGRRWDIAVDTSGYIPRDARRAADVLHDRVDRYAFVSSISVYPFPIPPNANETSALAEMPAGADPDDWRDVETYGARKVLCEAAIEARFPGRALIIRPGFIVGPHDNTDRFNSWIERAARPEPFIVPGDPEQPVQLIDVRDLAEWMIALAEGGATGVFNATGPERPATLREVAHACIAGTGSTAEPVVVPHDALKAAGVVPWEHVPFWLEPGEYGIMEANIDRALAAGLTFRPLIDTVRDTHAWLRSSDHPRRVVFPPELERAAVLEWMGN
jgi:2'-hydroxyisoflavone reductase